jgi:hypothetical protein
MPQINAVIKYLQRMQDKYNADPNPLTVLQPRGNKGNNMLLRAHIDLHIQAADHSLMY